MRNIRYINSVAKPYCNISMCNGELYLGTLGTFWLFESCVDTMNIHDSTVLGSFVRAFGKHYTCMTRYVLFVCFIHNKELDRGQTSLTEVLILRWISIVSSCLVSSFTIVCLKWCKTTQELSSKWTTNKRGICISLIHVVRGYSPYVVYGHKWYEYLYSYP